MIERSILRMAALVACLSFGQASPAGASSDLMCSVRNGTLSPRNCSAGSRSDVSRGLGICIGQTARLRSRAAPFTAVTMIDPAHRNLCLKANSTAPLSHLALQAEP